MDELREMAVNKVSSIKKAMEEKENREKSQQHQFNISKHYAQLPAPTFTNADVSNRVVNEGMTPERRNVDQTAQVPMLSPTLNFTLEEDF